VTAVLANSFAGQLIKGERINTEFSVEAHEGVTEAEEADSVAGEAGAKSGRETVTFEVSLHCGACEQRVQETLSEHDGVSDIRVDADRERVEITFNPHVTSPDELRRSIADLGYEVRQRQPATEGV